MSGSDRRHPQIVNVDEVEAMDNVQGSRFRSKIKPLARAAGSDQLGCNWFEVPPGCTSFPMHYHCAIEEAVFVLQGRGTLRLGDQEVEVRGGDWITLLAGPDGAHQLLNTGDAPLTYLCFSNKVRADVVGYPDSNKIAAMASPSNDFFAPPWVRAVFRADSTVGYFEGEDIGEE